MAKPAPIKLTKNAIPHTPTYMEWESHDILRVDAVPEKGGVMEAPFVLRLRVEDASGRGSITGTYEATNMYGDAKSLTISLTAPERKQLVADRPMA